MGNAFDQMAVQDNPQSQSVTPAPSPASTQAAPTSGNVFDQMAQKTPPAESTIPPKKDEAKSDTWNALSKMWDKAVVGVGHLVPQALTPAMAADVKYIANPVHAAGEWLAETGAEAGRTPAEILTGAEHFGDMMPSPYGQKPVFDLEKTAKEEHPNLSGIGEGTGRFVGTLMSPENLAVMVAMPESEAYPVLSKLLTKQFAGMMTAESVKGVKDLIKNWKDMTPQQRAEAITQQSLQGVMTLVTVGHALGGGKPEAAPVSDRGTVPGDRTVIRPTTQTTAGVSAPIAATQQADPSLLSRVMSHATTPGKANEFQTEFTKPAAQKQAISTLSQVATDKIAAHDALVNGDAAPEQITGTQTPGQHITPDEIWPEMQNTAGQTWQKARDASAHDMDIWNRERVAAEQAHKEAIDHYNDLVSSHNADSANAENPIEPHTFNPAEADVREKPQTYDELKAALDAAKDRTGRNNPTDVREKAKTLEVPKAEKALDSWFKEHEEQVSSEEYTSAKSLWADSERFKEIAGNLRGKLAKGTLTGNDIRGLEAVVDGKAITRRGQAGIGEFKRLLGPEAVDNLQQVAKLFDPLEKSDPRSGMISSWGGYVAKHVIATMMAPIFGVGYLGVEGLNALHELFMNHVLFDPDFGNIFKRFTAATKNAISTGTQVPADLLNTFKGKLSGIADRYKASKLGGEEGAVSLGGVKRANVGPEAGQKAAPLAGQPTFDMTEGQDDNGDKNHLLSISHNGEHVGHLNITQSTPDSWTINDASVRPDMQGRGLGTKAYQEAFKQAAANGMKTVESDISTTKAAAQTWEHLKSMYPDAITEENGQYAVDLSKIQGRNAVASVADAYNKSQGRPPLDTTKREIDSRGGNIADAYDKMKHDPNDPRVKASYKALIDETKAQRKFLESKGYKFDQSAEDPYKSFEEMRDDVKNNKHLSVWTGGNPFPEDHPLGKVDAETGWRNNDLVRGVHDIMGHVAGDNDFTEKGEENAYNLHQQTFSEQALPALTTETKGQTSWYQHNADVRAGGTPGNFPDQKAGLLPEHLYSKDAAKSIASLTNENGGATFNPTQGDLSGTDAYAVPMFRELSRTVEGDKVTPEQIKKYMSDPEVAAKLKADPKLSVGTWANGGKVYLDLSAAVKDRAEAIRLGTENGQKAITYLKTFEDIPTGGTGTGTPLEGIVGTKSGADTDTALFNQAKAENPTGSISDWLKRAQELKTAPKDLSASEITTRRPKAVGADLGNKPDQHANMAAVDQAGLGSPSRKTALGKGVMGYKEKLARTVAAYTGIDYSPEELANPDKVLNKFVNRAAGNIEWLYNQVPEEIRGRTRQWYDAANKVVSAKAESYGFTPEQGAGVTAALSPQNPWDNNIGLANRMMDIYRNRQNFPYSPEMEQKAAELKKVPTQSKAFKGLLRDIAGKTLSEVRNDDPDVQAVQRALWIRLYDESHGTPVNDQYAPTGEVVGHSPDTRSWIGLDHAGKAVKILENGSVDNINDVMGQGHKIRNFYNNIINPNSKAGHVTIDTHATAAAQLQPFGAQGTETLHTFGGTTKGTPGAPKDAATGLQGTYPLYAEAYQRVARKLGILPRELQSVTWEAIKALMGDEKKTPEMKSQVREIWQDVQDRKLTPAEARDKIKSAVNGFSKPAWMSDEEWEKTGAEGEDTSFMGVK